MNTQHTPGPWKVITSWEDFMVEGPNREEIIFQDGPHGTPTIKQANARLIAAAPENYACNKELAKIVRELCTTYGHPLPAASLDRSDTAIAKATGDKT